MAAQPNPIVHQSIDALRPFSGNARTHSKKQVRQIADSIRRFGFTNPVLISDDGEIIAGHAAQARTFTTLLTRAEADDARLKRDTFRYWRDVRQEAIERYAEARAAGEPPPLIVDPADIELRSDGAVEILGPTEPGDIAVMRANLNMVEYHLAEIAFHESINTRWLRRHGKPFRKGVLYAELAFFIECNALLPPRRRMSPEKYCARMAAYSRLPAREIHWRLRVEAAKLDLPVTPRDLRTPLIVPHEVIELSQQKGISGTLMLKAWLKAMEDYFKRP